MNSKVKEKFQSLEYQKEYLFSMMSNVTDDQANNNVEPDGWSLAQTLYHLYLVEQKTFEDISKRIKSSFEAKPVSAKEKFRHYLLKLFLRLPIKFKAPRAVSEDIPNNIDIIKLKEEWKNLREAFKLLLSVQSDEQLQLRLFKHPRVG